MSIIWNPWKALRDAEAKADADIQAERARTDRFALLATQRAVEISHLQKVLKHCHYRDPDTGRIGPKGKYPAK